VRRPWALALMMAAAPLAAAVAPNLDHGLALQGYDPVAYVDEAQALTGSAQCTAAYRGATYRFASPGHREAFLKAPAKYEPAYGGWCAYAMSQGKRVEVDPHHFKVVDGRLMLFFYAFYNDTLKKWDAQQARLLPVADAAWARLNAADPGPPGQK
jgi:YHS domain-containing protein